MLFITDSTLTYLENIADRDRPEYRSLGRGHSENAPDLNGAERYLCLYIREEKTDGGLACRDRGSARSVNMEEAV